MGSRLFEEGVGRPDREGARRAREGDDDARSKRRGKEVKERVEERMEEEKVEKEAVEGVHMEDRPPIQVF